jgi:hypothetical protein
MSMHTQRVHLSGADRFDSGHVEQPNGFIYVALDSQLLQLEFGQGLRDPYDCLQLHSFGTRQHRAQSTRAQRDRAQSTRAQYNTEQQHTCLTVNGIGLDSE